MRPSLRTDPVPGHPCAAARRDPNLLAGLRCAVIAARGDEIHYVRRSRCGWRGARPDQGIIGGRKMKGDQGKGAGEERRGCEGLRRDRLKLALRENLKRRKSQARGRGEASASSESADASLDTAGGEKP